MSTGFVTCVHGHRVAPADPIVAADGTSVDRLGLWPADAAGPWVLTVDEVACALALSGEEIGRYGLLAHDAADMAARGVRVCGRGPLAALAARWREGNERDGLPPAANPARCRKAAHELCRKAHRDRT
ncbi:hypothetical protein GCM10022222_40280 [Amycolatopsis ultiminotia]|uniref:DUF222 domain-containing protein n=1 Tax=Amycolatopsis ultiminotia TaxID=543629 RepID=A0ABP6WJV0_9PSEU